MNEGDRSIAVLAGSISTFRWGALFTVDHACTFTFTAWRQARLTAAATRTAGARSIAPTRHSSSSGPSATESPDDAAAAMASADARDMV